MLAAMPPNGVVPAPPRINFHQKMLQSLIQRIESDTGVDRLLEQQQVGNAELDRRISELRKLQSAIDGLTSGSITPYDRLPYPHEIPLSTATYSNAELNMMAMQASCEDAHRAQVIQEQLRVVGREVGAAEMEVQRLYAVLIQARKADESKDQRIAELEEQIQLEAERFKETIARKDKALEAQQLEHEEEVSRFNSQCDELMKQIDLQRAELLSFEMQERQLCEERDLQRAQNAQQAETVYALEAEDVRDKITLKRQQDVAEQLEVDRAIEQENNSVKQSQLKEIEEHARENRARFDSLLKDLEKKVQQLDHERARERWLHEMKTKELGALVQQSNNQANTFRTQAVDATRAIGALQQAVQDEGLLSARLLEQRERERVEHERETAEARARLQDSEARLAALQQQRDVGQALLERQRMDVQNLAVNDAITAATISQALLEARNRFPLPHSQRQPATG